MGSAKKEQNVYMPLMMGDWLRGTRGMRAEVRGVYINLLIHQYDHGYIPSDMETLSLIDPEVGKVWVLLKDKFFEFAPGKLQNKKLEDVRSFWSKQRKNGELGGRPKKDKPKRNPNSNPEPNPNSNLHNDIDYDNELKKLKEYDDWTEQIVDGNDHHFQTMFVNEGIPAGEHIHFLIMDHRDLLNRYPKMRPPNQQAFRKSCLKHIRENYKKQPNGKSNGTGNSRAEKNARNRDYLAKHYGTGADGK